MSSVQGLFKYQDLSFITSPSELNHFFGDSSPNEPVLPYERAQDPFTLEFNSSKLWGTPCLVDMTKEIDVADLQCWCLGYRVTDQTTFDRYFESFDGILGFTPEQQEVRYPKTEISDYEE
jgi:hypothetical protein